MRSAILLVFGHRRWASISVYCRFLTNQPSGKYLRLVSIGRTSSLPGRGVFQAWTSNLVGCMYLLSYGGQKPLRYGGKLASCKPGPAKLSTGVTTHGVANYHCVRSLMVHTSLWRAAAVTSEAPCRPTQFLPNLIYFASARAKLLRKGVLTIE